MTPFLTKPLNSLSYTQIQSYFDFIVKLIEESNSPLLRIQNFSFSLYTTQEQKTILVDIYKQSEDDLNPYINIYGYQLTKSGSHFRYEYFKKQSTSGGLEFTEESFDSWSKKINKINDFVRIENNKFELKYKLIKL